MIACSFIISVYKKACFVSLRVKNLKLLSVMSTIGAIEIFSRILEITLRLKGLFANDNSSNYSKISIGSYLI